MDTMTFLFIGIGLLLLFLPLPFVNSFFSDPNQPISYYSLIVPTIGGILLLIGFLAYHKYHLQTIFHRACSDFDQTGLGLGLGSTILNTFNSIFGQSGTEPEGFSNNELRALSTMPV
jgi:hypothetical protein